MIKSVTFDGPWNGVYYTTNPRKVPKGFVPYAENFRFRDGKAETIGGLTKLDDLPPDLGTVLHAETLTRRDGARDTILIGSNKVYHGAIGSWIDITNTTDPPSEQWGSAVDIDSVSTVHFVSGGSEWFVFTNGKDPGIFSWDLTNSDIVRIDLSATSLGYYQVKYVSYFKDRLMLANVTETVGTTQRPNAVGYSSPLGPFNFNTVDDAGEIELVDTEGPITALSKIQDYLVVFKTGSVTLLQYVNAAESLYNVITIAPENTGCAAHRSVQYIPEKNILVFAGMQDVNVFNGQGFQEISEQVRELFKQWALYDDGKTEITNLISGIVPAYDEYWLVFKGKGILAWNYDQNTWSIFRHYDSDDGLINVDAFAVGATLVLPLKINEATWLINDSVGVFNDYAYSASTDKPTVISGGVAYDISREVAQKAVLTLPQIKFQKPTTITRLVYELYAPNGGMLETKATMDGGARWLGVESIDVAPASDTVFLTSVRGSDRTTRTFWNFIATGDRFQNEILLRSQPQVSFVGVTLEFSVSREQEMVTPIVGESQSYGG